MAVGPDHKAKAERLSILQLGTQYNLGGIPRHMLTLTRSLRGAGHQVTLAGNAGTWCGPDTEPDFLELPIRYVAAEGGNLPNRLRNLASAVARLSVWLARNPVDVIHAHESAPALVAMMARLGRRIPVVVTYHGSEAERIVTFCRVARKCDVVITPSEGSARDLIDIGNLRADLVTKLDLGITPPPDDSAEEIASLRKQLLGDGERLIVTVARLADQKAIDVLIDCVAALKTTHPGYRFVLVGSGPLEEHYKALAREKGVMGHLNFVGRQERVHLFLRASDLFLLTSRYEAFGIVVVEAFQSALPVVATACRGVVELVDDRVGQTVPIGDVPAICAEVERILEDERLRSSMGAAALARSREARFDPDWVNDRYVDTYRAALTARKG